MAAPAWASSGGGDMIRVNNTSSLRNGQSGVGIAANVLDTSQKVHLLQGAHAFTLAIADLDGDKKDDLIIGDGKNIAIYFNDSP